MTRNELIEDIQDELTFSRALPFALPEKEINRVINIAADYFYDNWRHAVQTQYLLLPLALYNKEEFRKFRQIRLPECIAFVETVKEIKNGSVFGTIDRDFSEQKFVGSEIFLTPFMGESIVYRTVIFSFLDLTKGLIIDTIAFDFNKNNKTIMLKGRNPKVDTVAVVQKKIEEHDLYDDELFKRYVRAKAKVRLGELVTSFGFKLPGGVEINYDTMVTKAEAELGDVIKQMEGENTPDFMVLHRQ